jgi:ferredoxin
MVRQEDSAETARPVPVALPSLRLLPSVDDQGFDGISAAVADLARGHAPEFSGERIALTSGATHDSAVSDVLNTSEDGAVYWGPIDNDSARSKAAKETLIIDQWECIQCGTCVENTDAVFALPDDCKASVFKQTGAMDLIQDAIDACPVTCIQWTADPDSFEQLNDHMGQKLA